MIDAKKVRMMEKIAVYEEGVGKNDIRIYRYKKNTYVNMKQLQSILAVTVAYILAVGIYCIKFYTQIMVKGSSFRYERILIYAVVIYAMLIFLDIILTRMYYCKKYEETKIHIKEYENRLYQLKKYIENTEEIS